MTISFVKLEDVGNHILNGIRALERKTNMHLSLSEKVLLTEIGTVEEIISILINSQTIIKVLKQKEKDGVIKREVLIINKLTGDSVACAKSSIFCSFLPKKIVKQIELMNESIGSILRNYQLETFRKIVKIGYESKTRRTFKIYQIIYHGLIAIEIKETFII
jgi:chorismate-pyruvate lyase